MDVFEPLPSKPLFKIKVKGGNRLSPRFLKTNKYHKIAHESIFFEVVFFKILEKG